MKKLLSMLLALLITTSVTFAQNQTKTTATKQTTETSVKTKKDGTPDMRTKEAKAAKKDATTTTTTTKTKKDGTPDMRYKENKTKTTTSTTTK